MSDFQLRGNMGEKGINLVNEFLFVVNSCESMNDIYRSSFGEVWADTCKDYETEIKPNLQRISIQIKIATAFFDPQFYNDHETLILDATYSSTTLFE